MKYSLQRCPCGDKRKGFEVLKELWGLLWSREGLLEEAALRHKEVRSGFW